MRAAPRHQRCRSRPSAGWTFTERSHNPKIFIRPARATRPETLPLRQLRQAPLSALGRQQEPIALDPAPQRRAFLRLHAMHAIHGRHACRQRRAASSQRARLREAVHAPRLRCATARAAACRPARAHITSKVSNQAYKSSRCPAGAEGRPTAPTNARLANQNKSTLARLQPAAAPPPSRGDSALPERLGGTRLHHSASRVRRPRPVRQHARTAPCCLAAAPARPRPRRLRGWRWGGGVRGGLCGCRRKPSPRARGRPQGAGARVALLGLAVLLRGARQGHVCCACGSQHARCCCQWLRCARCALVRAWQGTRLGAQAMTWAAMVPATPAARAAAGAGASSSATARAQLLPPRRRAPLPLRPRAAPRRGSAAVARRRHPRSRACARGAAAAVAGGGEAGASCVAFLARALRFPSAPLFEGGAARR